MGGPRDIRRLAFQVLFQLDAAGGDALELARSIEEGEFTSAERARAAELATASYLARESADAIMLEFAPGWPAHRQPAVDRAILRLAHFEITSGNGPGPAIINEAVELAKHYGTDKSPGFVNALLDRLLKTQSGESVPPGPIDIPVPG
jgi:N utilization substance protein B